MSRRICATPGCPTIVDAGAYRGLCATCARARDRDRGTRDQRGYGAEHQRTRRQWQARIDAGQTVTCWRCGAPITGTAWHVGHDDHDRSITRGPECAPCNLATRSRRG